MFRHRHAPSGAIRLLALAAAAMSAPALHATTYFPIFDEGLGAGGAINVHAVLLGGTVHFILDVNGYYE